MNNFNYSKETLERMNDIDLYNVFIYLENERCYATIKMDFRYYEMIVSLMKQIIEEMNNRNMKEKNKPQIIKYNCPETCEAFFRLYDKKP